MFTKYNLDNQSNLFTELSQSVEFEDICQGRKGAILVDSQNNLIPIIRTTTIYHQPVQQFLPIHHNLITQLKQIANCNHNHNHNYDLTFNNAMIEIYEPQYYKMKYHTDQSLDFASDSLIGLFSCYEFPTQEIRTLQVKNKRTEQCREISLEHNSFVLFSTSTNHEHLHKIVFNAKIKNNRWLGITFRLSKTWIQFIDERPYFVANHQPLTMANDNEKRQLYQYKGLENIQINYLYPEITYTISPSDCLNLKQLI